MGTGGWCSEDAAQRRGLGELGGEPRELLGGESPLGAARQGAVEHDDAQPADPHDVVVGLRPGPVQELPAERRALVVVAHRVDERRPDPLRRRLDDRPQRAIGGRVAGVGEVAGEHESGDGQPGALDGVERNANVVEPLRPVDVDMEVRQLDERHLAAQGVPRCEVRVGHLSPDRTKPFTICFCSTR